MTGLFGALPAELIVVVVDAVLLLPIDAGLDLIALAARSAEAVRDLATTCSALRAVITSAQLREARARLRFRLGPSKRLLAAEPYPYTALLHRCVRAEIDKRALQTVTREAILHCAKPGAEMACCAAIRKDWNARYVSLADSARGWLSRTKGIAYDDANSLESVALGEAMGRRSRMQVSVVDALGTLHTTAEGRGVLVDTGFQEVVRYGTAPAAEYTPGQEFEPLARTPYEGKCQFVVAHPSGNVTVVTHPAEATEDYEWVYTITTWTADGTRKVMELTEVKSTDVASNLKFGIDLCKERGPLTSAWAQGECVWLLFEVDTEDWVGQHKTLPFVARIDTVPILCDNTNDEDDSRGRGYDYLPPNHSRGGLDGHGVVLGETHRLHSFTSSATSGNAVFLTQEYTPNSPVLILSYFDATRAKATEGIDEFHEDVTLTDEAQKNKVIMEEACLTKDGLHIIAAGRKALDLWVRIYKRVSEDEWTPLQIGDSSTVMNSCVPPNCTMIGPVVSPCSTKILFFHKSSGGAVGPNSHIKVPCNCNVLDLKETLYSGKWCNQSWYVWHESVPKECYWSDGLFVQARGGGVLRLGLVDAQ